MKSSFGTAFKVQLFGESHGTGVGCVIEGMPAGLTLSEKDVQAELDKRKPGQKLTTPRKEEDHVEILSGVFKGKTTGAPLALFIRNHDADSTYYEEIKNTPRPGHADFVVSEKYGGFNDYRGSGPLSGRLTAAMVCAGAVAKKLLATQGVESLAHIVQIHDIKAGVVTDEQVRTKTYESVVRCPDKTASEKMVHALEKAKKEGDSLGAVVEGRIVNVPAGIGEPLLDSVEGTLAYALFGIPAVKGVEFGEGFSSVTLKGSEHNDPFEMIGGKVRTGTNHAGGILGGMTNGMPVVFKVAFKPASSILKKQVTLDLEKRKQAEMSVKGRHDPCVAIRAVPVVECIAACVMADLMIRAQIIPRVLR